jgi:protein kinase-like protein/PEGA domain-containing protein
VLHQIGIGTLGPVFRTYEPSRDRLVAVKVFRLDIVPEQAQALAAALSRAAHASLFHPSIVEPIDAGVEGTLAYRAEEYVAAESLDVAMRHYAPAPLGKVLPFITQLGGAIDFARAAGIGHGGLHPRDIFVTPDEARATGFGVVDALEQVGIRAPIRRPYSAPERIDGRAWSTPADVFSLAAITFELLTGKRPAGTGSQIGVLPESPFASAMHAVLARAMHDDPAARYPSALAFAGALDAASQGRPLTDAASQGTAVAVVPESPVAAPPPVMVATPAPTESDREPDVATRKPKAGSRKPESGSREPVAPRGEPVAPTPGEFAVEAALDPVHEALDDLTARQAPQDDRAEVRPAIDPTPVGLFEPEDAGEPERFIDDFAPEQREEPTVRSPLEAEVSELPPPPVEAPMFRTADPEPDVHDYEDRSRSSILPYALILVLGLLVGFGGGYFVGNRDRITPSDGQTVAQYSEQKVSPVPAAQPQAAEPKDAEPKAEPKAAEPATPAAAAAAPVEHRAAPKAAEPTTPVRPSRGAVAPRGQIVVRSLPNHAGVTINGTWRGRTPLTLENLALGEYAVRVVQPGYQVLREEFALSASAPSHTVTARLELAAPAVKSGAPATPTKGAPAGKAAASDAPQVFSGSLYVDSRPRGANVLVDGRTVGQTPLSLPDVPVGSHVVRIEMDGKKPVTANPRVTAGKTERVTVSLEDK